MEAKFRPTYSLQSLGNEPGMDEVVTRGTNRCCSVEVYLATHLVQALALASAREVVKDSICVKCFEKCLHRGRDLKCLLLVMFLPHSFSPNLPHNCREGTWEMPAVWGLEINFWAFFSLLGKPPDEAEVVLVPLTCCLLCSCPHSQCSLGAVPWHQHPGWELLDYPMGPGSIKQLRRATAGASPSESKLTGLRRAA